MKTSIVTTSWDDGSRFDLRLAEILRSRHIRGTFYIPIVPYLGRPALSHDDLRALSVEGFEIGAHGFSHKHLWKLSEEELMAEISPCKPILENILGTEVRMFCYPRGRYDASVVRALKEMGYWGARTVRMLATRLDFDPFTMPTTVQISRHTRFTYFKNVLRGRTIEGLQTSLANLNKLGSWFELAKGLFDSVLENGGVWHLYGHSREIEDLGLWKDLEEILDYVCHRENVTYLPNWEVIPIACSQASYYAERQSICCAPAQADAVGQRVVTYEDHPSS
jgi:peptidoglycan/xylan/chitin deacetylase (PgdA/CDA1 family)